MKRYGIAIGVLGVFATLWWWMEQPKTPEEMFLVRCSTCHALPNLSEYTNEQIPGVIQTMRERNGAGDIIDEDEAQMIVDYILSQRRANERSAESR